MLAFDTASARRPGDAHARLGSAISRIPVVAVDEAEIARSQADYGDALRAFDQDLGTGIAAADLASATGSIQPFHLAYGGENDAALQSLYGGLLARAAADAGPCPPPRSRGTDRLRIAIVAGFFRDHPVWNVLLDGWTRRCRDAAIETIGFHTGAGNYARTSATANQLTRLVTGPRPKTDWAALLRDTEPDAILYPEIGMDPIVPFLAVQRLAPLQLAAWGHPTTTGLPTIDRVLGSEAMEPPDAERHYTETLVRLPGLGFVPAVPPAPARLRREGDPDETLFWCGQHLAKYRPRHDDLFPRIACVLPSARFLFVSRPVGQIAEAVFRRRLARAFAAHGLTADLHCRFLPYRDADRYRAALAASDVFLDTIGWSGLTTTLDAIACGVPIVTLESGLMRGRQSAALLRRIGIAGGIDQTEDGFVARAIVLGKDRDERAHYTDLIVTGRFCLAEEGRSPSAPEALRVALSLG